MSLGNPVCLLAHPYTSTSLLQRRQLRVTPLVLTHVSKKQKTTVCLKRGKSTKVHEKLRVLRMETSDRLIEPTSLSTRLRPVIAS